MPDLQLACERAMTFPACEHSFDLIAIGGALAGLVAALCGAEQGLRTAVLEAGARRTASANQSQRLNRLRNRLEPTANGSRQFSRA
jgi:thioredoxin reductase (NADPH)